MEWLEEKIKTIDPDITIGTMIWLQFSPMLDDDSVLTATWLTSEAMEYVWSRRKKKEDISIPFLTAHLLSNCAYLESTTKFKQAALLIKDLLQND